MKQTKIFKILLSVIFLGICSYMGFTYATGTGIKWIDDTSTSARFTDVGIYNGQEAYKDTFTGLYWEKTPVGGSKTWQNALDYCSNLGSGWRLPTINEMFSIMVDTNAERYDNSAGKPYTALPSITTTSYWSSTTVADNTSFAWYGYFYYGNVLSNDKTTSINTICTHN